MSAVINFYHGDSDIIPMCNYFWLYQQQVLYSGTHKYQNLFTMLYKASSTVLVEYLFW